MTTLIRIIKCRNCNNNLTILHSTQAEKHPGDANQLNWIKYIKSSIYMQNAHRHTYISEITVIIMHDANWPLMN